MAPTHLVWMAFILPAAVWAQTFMTNFTLVPAPGKGIVDGTKLKIDYSLEDQCVEFAAQYYPHENDMSPVPTLYQPPWVPPGYDLRLFQDPACTKPVWEDEWPWEEGVIYDESADPEWVFGYYQLSFEGDNGGQAVPLIGDAPSTGVELIPAYAYDTTSEGSAVQESTTNVKSAVDSSAVAMLPAARAMSAYFTLLLEYSSTNEWESLEIPTTDYTRCYALNPTLRARRSFRGLVSNTGSRDAQPGIRNMSVHFPAYTTPPDISIKIFRTPPPARSSGGTSCYEAPGSRDSIVVNLKWWRDLHEDDRLKWLKPRWWSPFYYRIRETDSFMVLPPPSQPARRPASMGSGEGGIDRATLTQYQKQRVSEPAGRQEELLNNLAALGIEAY
ncbi:hypothetical protein Dda_6640 [Drechslerella dactyloides]|uniref:Uncharacterized protein n=1 Tax=Drechslerella dactyloides TaxID=74499 RepID=A0AAD6NHK8_DREDA|nr:hypothetical protein Dda_6640 [Drechslerella dactyloides]